MSRRVLAPALLATALVTPSSALADDLILDFSEQINLLNADGVRMSGNWARIYPHPDETNDGWIVFITGANTYNYVELDADFQPLGTKQRLVTDWPQRLVDHMITQCPDGTYFHVASANITVPDDSAYIFRYDEDLNLLCSGTIAESDTRYQYNDAPLVCTGGATANPMDGTATHTGGEDVQTPFVFFDENCERRTRAAPDLPPVSGSSILYDDRFISGRCAPLRTTSRCSSSSTRPGWNPATTASPSTPWSPRPTPPAGPRAALWSATTSSWRT